MTKDIASLSIEEKSKIASRARRNARSEAGLILSGGGAALAVLLFVLGFPGVLWLSSTLGLNETGAWVVMSFGIAAVLALFHLRVAPRVIEEAKRLDAEIHKAEEHAKRADQEKKIAAMKADGAA